MSQKQNYPIQCPQCAHAQEVELYDSINVRENPELRAALMANQLNQVHCSSCGFAFRVDKALLYSDPGRKTLIYWMPSGLASSAKGQELFQRALAELRAMLPDGMESPSLHLVTQRVELIERIYLLEAGLDPRIIEYIKYSIYLQNLGRLPPERKNLLFDAEDSNEKHLVFVVQDVPSLQLETVIQYEREAYAALARMFDRDEHTPNLLELFPGPSLSARELLLRENLGALPPPAGPKPSP